MYATFAALTWIALAAGPTDHDPNAELRVILGHNSPSKLGPGHDGILSLQYTPKRELFPAYGIKPCFVVGASTDGMRYVTTCITKSIKLGPVIFTPSFGPTLYSSGQAPKPGKHGSEQLQFRTSMELQLPLKNNWRVGAGFYHMSNAGMTKNSAGVDVIFTSLQVPF